VLVVYIVPDFSRGLLLITIMAPTAPGGVHRGRWRRWFGHISEPGAPQGMGAGLSSIRPRLHRRRIEGPGRGKWICPRLSQETGGL